MAESISIIEELSQDLFEKDLASKYEIVLSCIKDMEHNTRHHLEFAKKSRYTAILGNYTERVSGTTNTEQVNSFTKRSVYKKPGVPEDPEGDTNTDSPAEDSTEGLLDEKKTRIVVGKEGQSLKEKLVGTELHTERNLSSTLDLNFHGNKRMEDQATVSLVVMKSSLHIRPTVASFVFPYVTYQIFARSKTVIGLRLETCMTMLRSCTMFMWDNFRAHVDIASIKIEEYDVVSKKNAVRMLVSPSSSMLTNGHGVQYIENGVETKFV